MSARYDWWGYAKGMVRRYPELVQRQRDLKSTAVTARLDGMPRASGMGRPVEQAALRTLPPAQLRELAAVRQALRQTRDQPRGEEKLALVQMVYWKQSHNLAGAAMVLEISEITAKRWNGEFLRRVGRSFGLLDE